MTTPYDTYKNAILGIPFQLNKKPSRQGAVKAFAEMQKQLEGAQSGALVKDTLANLQALTSVSEASVMAWVVNDTTQANNGIYENTGSASNPSWTRRSDIPQFIIAGVNEGNGTANAIEVSTDLAIPVENARCLIMVPIVEDNTTSTTVSFNGGTPKTVKSISGANVLAGSLLQNMVVTGYISDDNFYLVTDIASASIVTQAEAARDAALNVASYHYQERNQATADIVGALPNGTIVEIAGFKYVRNTSTVLADSALADFNISGVDAMPDASGFVDQSQFGIGTSGDQTAKLKRLIRLVRKFRLTGNLETSETLSATAIENPHIEFEDFYLTYTGSSGSVQLLSYQNVDLFYARGRGVLDCDGLASIPLEVRFINGARGVDCEGLEGINGTQSGSNTSGAAGLQFIQNTGATPAEKIHVHHCRVNNITRTTGDAAGSACSGIVAVGFKHIDIEHNDIDGIYKGNGTEDADGIKIFSQTTGSWLPVTGKCNNNRIYNCEGRWVKTQVQGYLQCLFNDVGHDEVLDLINSFRGFDCQIGATHVRYNQVTIGAVHTGGGEAYIWQGQFTQTPLVAGDKRYQSFEDNYIFYKVAAPSLSRICFVNLTGLGTYEIDAHVSIRNNVCTRFDGTSMATIAVTVSCPKGTSPTDAFISGSHAWVDIKGNTFHATNFMERFANGDNASSANDFKDFLGLDVTDNKVPIDADIPVLPHDANNSWTSKFRCSGNSVGNLGDEVEYPFDFAEILSGSNFYVGGDPSPVKTNGPTNDTYGRVSRDGANMYFDSRLERWAALFVIGGTPAWDIYGKYEQSAVSSPTGGSTIDVEARTAIDDLRARLQSAGIINS